jgi:hypothetical protein
MQADADTDALIPGLADAVPKQGVLYFDRTGQSLSRRGERDHDGIANGLDLVALVRLDLSTDDFPMCADNVVRDFVPLGRSQNSGPLYIREEERDGTVRDVCYHARGTVRALSAEPKPPAVK